jgi:dATP/dGTP diphosphohydrolase
MSDPKIGIGGAPTRATTLPEDPKLRKQHPIASGLMDYFPDALVAVSAVSWKGNEQHNPGQPLHWNRSKSSDEADTMLRHFLQRGSLDTDGTRHSAKMVWRALALLQKEIEIESERDSNSVGSGRTAPTK